MDHGDNLTVFMFFLIGCLAGFLSSSPLGPINLWLVNRVYANHTSNMLQFLAGVILADVVFGCIALWGYQTILIPPVVSQYLSAFLGLVLIAMGGWMLRATLWEKTGKTQPTMPIVAKGSWMEFATGVFFCASNPGFLLFWLSIVDASLGYFQGEPNGSTTFMFAFGIIVGDGAWFYTLYRLTHKSRETLSKDWIFNIRCIISCVFMGVGVYGIGSSVF